MKRVRLKAIGKRGQQRKRDLARIRVAILERADGACEAATPACIGRGTQIHHRLRRSQGGGETLTNCLLTCAACHSFIHDHPMWAYETGLLLRSAA